MLLRIIFIFIFVPDTLQDCATASLRACGWNKTASCIYLFQHYCVGLLLITIVLFGVVKSLVLVWLMVAVDILLGLTLAMGVLVFRIDFEVEAERAGERLGEDSPTSLRRVVRKEE